MAQEILMSAQHTSSVHDDLMKVLSDTYDTAIAQQVRTQFLDPNHFEIISRPSDHVLRINWTEVSAIRAKSAAVVAGEMRARLYPHKDDERAQDPRASEQIRATESRIDELFHVAPEHSTHERKIIRTGTLEHLFEHMCPICRAIRARDQSTIVHDCCDGKHSWYLLLCPDAIIAQCSTEGCKCAAFGSIIGAHDEPDQEPVTKYIAVYHLSIPHPMLNPFGSWSFDFIHRIKFDMLSREGFVAFRTYVICNIARVTLPSNIIDRIIPRVTDSAPCTRRDVQDATDSAHGISRFARFRAKLSRAKSSTHPQHADTSHKDRATIDDTVSSIRHLYIIRDKINDIEISLTPARDFIEAFSARSAHSSIENARELESAVNNIFDQEPQREYIGLTFKPSTRSAEDIAARAIGARDFNLWRGWKWIVPYTPPDPCAQIAQILNYIGTTICATDQVIMRARPGQHYRISELTRMFISFFARIIQTPQTIGAHRFLILRGFHDDQIARFIRFIGLQVIGAQYYTRINQSHQAITAQNPLRADCLLCAIDASFVSRECIMSIIDSDNGATLARMIIIAQDPRWQAPRDVSLIIAPWTLKIDAKTGITDTDSDELYGESSLARDFFAFLSHF